MHSELGLSVCAGTNGRSSSMRSMVDHDGDCHVGPIDLYVMHIACRPSSAAANSPKLMTGIISLFSA